MSTQETPVTRIVFSHTEGKLPGWFWKGVAGAERATRDGSVPVLVVKDGQRSLIVVDSHDWNALLAERDIERVRDES